MFKLWFTVLCVFGGCAHAAIDPSDPCGRRLSFDANLTIETQGDADAFSSCTRTNLNVVISKRFPGSFICKLQNAGRSIYVGQLTDRPSIEDSTLTSVSFPDLTYVDDDVHLSGANGLTTLSFPRLETVQGTIVVVDLPNLSTFDMFTRLQHASYISIINTGLRRIEWDPYGEIPKLIEFYVSNNTNLRELSIPAVENISGGGLYIHGTGRTRVYNRLRLVNFIEMTGVEGWMEESTGFDFLEYSANRGASSPWYKIWNNTFDTLGFPALEYTNGSIDIHYNPNLASLSFSRLRRVNAELSITDNPSLTKLNYSALGSLGTVQTINLTGAFESVDLPLSMIRPSTLIVGSTANISCVPFDEAWKLSWITSLYGCSANGQRVVLETNATKGKSKSGAANSRPSADGTMLTVVLTLSVMFCIFL